MKKKNSSKNSNSETASIEFESMNSTFDSTMVPFARSLTEFKIEIYLDDGRIFWYFVDSHDSVREHTAAIVEHGYRHNDGKIFEHYPAHRILKVKCRQPIPTKYPDNVGGT